MTAEQIYDFIAESNGAHYYEQDFGWFGVWIIRGCLTYLAQVQAAKRSGREYLLRTKFNVEY